MTQPFEFMGRRVPIAETLGMELVERGEGRAAPRWAVREEFTNPLGQVQGGVYGVLMDTAMAIAADGIATATMQFSILRPAVPGMVLAISAEVVRAGRNIVYAEAEVRDDAGRLVARGNQNGLPRDRQ